MVYCSLNQTSSGASRRQAGEDAADSLGFAWSLADALSRMVRGYGIRGAREAVVIVC